MWRVSCASSPPRCGQFWLPVRTPSAWAAVPWAQVLPCPQALLCPPQERQSIIRFWLQNLRAKQGEALHNVRFLEDQPISKQAGPISNHTWGVGWGS